jgi:hypothetical protein
MKGGEDVDGGAAVISGDDWRLELDEEAVDVAALAMAS